MAIIGERNMRELRHRTELFHISFDILQTRLYKSYVNLSNIVLRVSDGTSKGKEHAILVNAHLDSTLPSPGAGDDALSVGVMIEIARNLVLTKDWEPSHAIIFRTLLLIEAWDAILTQFTLDSVQQRRGISAGWFASVRHPTPDSIKVSDYQFLL